MSEQILNETKDWLKIHRAKTCPKCLPQNVRPGFIKGTFYCSNCDKYWMVQRNKYSGVYNWLYKEIIDRVEK